MFFTVPQRQLLVSALLLTNSLVISQYAAQEIITQTYGFDTVLKALKKSSIIPTVLDDFTPKCFILPAYHKHNSVVLGNKVKTSATKARPKVRIYCPGLTNFPALTLALTDPDAPSRDNPEWSEMCHWIARVGVGSEDVQRWNGGARIAVENGLEIDINVEEEEYEWEVMPYKAPGPPPQTGYHRYVFVLLEGNNTSLEAPQERQYWGFGKEGHGVRDWAGKEGLWVVGANWFVQKNKKQ